MNYNISIDSFFFKCRHEEKVKINFPSSVKRILAHNTFNVLFVPRNAVDLFPGSKGSVFAF